DQAAQLCIAYPDAGVYVLNLRQHPREQIRWLELAAGAARRLKQRGREGNALGNLGLAHANLGESRRAIEFYEQALLIDREIGDRVGEATGLWNMSLSLNKLGERVQAITCAEQALTVYEQIEAPYAARVRAQVAKWRTAQD